MTLGVRAAGLATVALLVSAGAGCVPPVTYTPEVAGVVTSQGGASDGSYRIVLADGRSHRVDTHKQRIILGGGVPVAGDLLLAGTAPSPWIARLAKQFDCFWVGGIGVEDDGHITTDRGLRLPKAREFDRAHYGVDEHEFHSGGFCINNSGEVTGVQ